MNCRHMNSFSDHVNGILFRLISSESGRKRFYIFMKVVKVTGERKGENKILPLKFFLVWSMHRLVDV